MPTLPLAAGGIYLTGAALLALGVTGITGGLSLLFVGPWILQPIVPILDREPGLKDALSALVNANLKEHEVLPNLRKKIKEERKILVNDPVMVQEALAHENRNRLFNNLPPLTEEELIKMVLNSPLPSKRPSNGIDAILEKLNKKLSRRKWNTWVMKRFANWFLMRMKLTSFAQMGDL